MLAKKNPIRNGNFKYCSDCNTDYEEKQSSQMAKELILKKAFLSKKW